MLDQNLKIKIKIKIKEKKRKKKNDDAIDKSIAPSKNLIKG